VLPTGQRTRLPRKGLLLLALVAVAGCFGGGSEGDGPAVATIGSTVHAEDWELTVTGLQRATSLAGSEGRVFRPPPDQTFLVVAFALHAAGAKHERTISSNGASLVGTDHVVYPAVGGGEGPVCANCVFDLSTDAKEISLKFVFLVGERSARQSFAFRYDKRSPAFALSLAGAPDPHVVEVKGTSPPIRGGVWRTVTPGGKTRCARGAPYAFLVRRADPEKLLVYFGGGGGCFDYRSCAPATALFNDRVAELDEPNTPNAGIFDATNARNPFRRYTIVYIPSCTGDVHIGNKTTTYKGPGGREVRIHHRGLVNARAALSWAYRNVPAAREVFVTGCSAGSVASIVYAPYLIKHYPNASVTQLGDSNAFVFHRPVNLAEDWRAQASLPAWIPALRKMASRFTMARYYTAVARFYPRNAFAQFNFAEDPTQAEFYGAVGGDPSEFPAALRASLRRISDGATNFRCFLAFGAGHCILGDVSFYNEQTGGAALRGWVARLARGRPVSSVKP